VDWTIDDVENFLEDSDDYDTLSIELITDILGEEEGYQFIDDFDLEFDADDEIPWKEFPSMLNFDELCQDDNFIALIMAYFDCDEITIVGE
jgi:hypothetical protein